jgi:hypothetical protein
LVSDIKGRTQTEGISEKDAEDNIWNEEVRNREELHNLYFSPYIIKTNKSRE